MLVKTLRVPIFGIYSKRVKSSHWSWSACITCIFYLELMRDIRDALDCDSFGTFRENFLRTYKTTKETD